MLRMEGLLEMQEEEIPDDDQIQMPKGMFGRSQFTFVLRVEEIFVADDESLGSSERKIHQNTGTRSGSSVVLS